MAIHISIDDLENEDIFNKVVDYANSSKEEKNEIKTQSEIDKLKIEDKEVKE